MSGHLQASFNLNDLKILILKTEESYELHREVCSDRPLVCSLVELLDPPQSGAGGPGTLQESALRLSVILSSTQSGREALNAAEAWRGAIHLVHACCHVWQEDGGSMSWHRHNQDYSRSRKRSRPSYTSSSSSTLSDLGSSEASSLEEDGMQQSGQASVESALKLLVELLYDESGPSIGMLVNIEEPLLLDAVQKAWVRARAVHMSLQASESPHLQKPPALLRDLAALVCRLAVEPVAAGSPGQASSRSGDNLTLGQLLACYSGTGSDFMCDPLHQAGPLQRPGGKPVEAVCWCDGPSRQDTDPRLPPSDVDAIMDAADGVTDELASIFLQVNWERLPLHLKPDLKHAGPVLLEPLLQPGLAAISTHLLPSCCHIPLQKKNVDDALQALREARSAGLLGEAWPRVGQDLNVVHNGMSIQDKGSRATAGACRSALKAGHTCVLRAVGGRWGGGCTEVQRALGTALGLTAASNLYVTPPGQQGLAAHYDDHCVMVVQLEGSKKWLVQPPAPSHRLPLSYKPRETLVPIIKGSPGVTEVWMQRGDLLYLPRGWAHQAFALGSASDSTEAEHEDASTAGAEAPDAFTTEAMTGDASGAHPCRSERSSPSVHVTVGVEVDGDSSWAALLHLAMAVACGSGSISTASSGVAASTLQQDIGSVASDGAMVEQSTLGAGCVASSPDVVRESSGDEGVQDRAWRLYCQTVGHAWVSQASSRAHILRKACPLLALPKMQRALLNSTLNDLLAETSPDRGSSNCSETAAWGPTLAKGDRVAGGGAAGATDGDCCLLHSCWGLLLQHAVDIASLEEAHNHVSSARLPTEVLSGNAGPTSDPARTLPFSSAPSAEGFKDSAEDLVHESLAWRCCIWPESSKEPCSAAKDMAIDMISRDPDHGAVSGGEGIEACTLCDTSQTVGQWLGKRLPILHDRMTCTLACQAWTRITSKRTAAARALEEAMLALHHTI